MRDSELLPNDSVAVQENDYRAMVRYSDEHDLFYFVVQHETSPGDWTEVYACGREEGTFGYETSEFAADVAREDFGNFLEELKPVRTAHVRGARDAAQVKAYLPAGYKVTGELEDGTVVIQGRDYAGWTLEDYVIPRMASGLIWAREVEPHV